jgi:hypothetical protein
MFLNVAEPCFDPLFFEVNLVVSLHGSFVASETLQIGSLVGPLSSYVSTKNNDVFIVCLYRDSQVHRLLK